MSFDFAKDPLRTLKPTSIEQRLDFLAERIAAVEKGQVPLGELPDLVEELGRELRSFTTIKQEIEAIREGVPEKLAEALAATLKGSAIQLRPLIERAERTERQVGHLGDAIKALSNRPAVLPVPGEDGGTAGAFATLRRDLMALESSLSDRLTGLSGAITKLAEAAPLLPPPQPQPQIQAQAPRTDASERALITLTAEVAQLRELMESSRGDKAVVINPATSASTGAIVDTLTAMRRDLEMLSQVNVAERTAPVIRAELDDLHQLLSREIDRIGQNQTELTSRLESLAGLAGPRRRSWGLLLGLVVGAAIGGIAVLAVIGLLPGSQTRQPIQAAPPPAMNRIPEAPRPAAPVAEPQRIQPAPAPPAATPVPAPPAAQEPANPAPPPAIETPRRRLVPGSGAEPPKTE